jgi:hypothetical protein
MHPTSGSNNSDYPGVALGRVKSHYGQAGHDNVLLGMHFIQSNIAKALRKRKDAAFDPAIIAPVAGFWDYITYMSDDLAHVSYVDFWRWWSELERYKGDEAGLAQLDGELQACLARGMKVKIDLAWTTWYTCGKDWEQDLNTAVGPEDIADWIHLCDLLGRRFRGRMALWMLQGEANTLKEYWQSAPIEHVQEVYRSGYTAFKRVDPGVLISISGATPSVSKAALDEWCRANIAACRGMFDEIPMNYFADIRGADPYNGLENYYQAIRSMLDAAGEDQVEIGSGESSIQYAEDSWHFTLPPPVSWLDFDPITAPLSEMKQAWRMNESMRDFYRLGGNKLMWWSSESAPGVGWPWRWGFHKYEDWWGIWPETHKIPGTRIVYRYENDDPEKLKRNNLIQPLTEFNPVDLHPGWVRPADPYHPIWEVYKYWAQATPPGGEAVRLPAVYAGQEDRAACIATYLQTEDRLVALVHRKTEAAGKLTIDLSRTGWAEAATLEICSLLEDIHFATSQHITLAERIFQAKAQAGKLVLDLPEQAGFSTYKISLHQPDLAAEFVQVISPELVETGQEAQGMVILRNTGTCTWPDKEIGLAVYQVEEARRKPQTAENWCTQNTAPGELCALAVNLPASEAPGCFTGTFRLVDHQGRWFGPVIFISYSVVELDAPRKLVAFREVGHLRLKWFAPVHASGVSAYKLYRADGFQQPMNLIKQFSADLTSFVDDDLEMDRAYFYALSAVSTDGIESRLSNEDNARALSTARIWDAEIVQHTIPERIAQGEMRIVSVTLRNTGTKVWDFGKPKEEKWFYVNNTQLWGSQDEEDLPKITIVHQESVLSPGEMVEVSFPYAGPQPGRYENHWVLCVSLGGKCVYFGTPLLVETVVELAKPE